MGLRFKTLVLLLGVAIQSYGFFPPLGQIVKEVFGERRGPIGVEAHFKHRVMVQSNEVVEIDERVIRDSSGIYFLWRIPALQAQPIAAIHEKQAYWISKERSFPTRSTVLWKYFTAESDDSIRDALLVERFIRRDHFYQYKPGFTPQGDPSTWNVKENYFRHDDIFLFRLPQGVSIAVNGYQEGNTARSVFFDQNLKGMTRLEWKDGDTVAAWNFEGFMKSVWEKAFIPKRANLEINRTVLVTSETVSLRALKDRTLFEAKSNWKAASKNITISSNAEAALKLLVSYR